MCDPSLFLFCASIEGYLPCAMPYASLSTTSWDMHDLYCHPFCFAPRDHMIPFYSMRMLTKCNIFLPPPPPPPPQPYCKVMLAMGGMGRREPTNSVEQYSANMTQWKAVNPMVTNRWGAGAVILDNSIYVVGGSNISRLNTVDRYDLKEEKWCTDVAEMASARNGVGVVALGGESTPKEYVTWVI